MVKEDLETVIDRLLDYVQTNKSVTLNAASKALALNANQVERLALLLEESELMEVQYTIFGVRLVPRHPGEEDEASKREEAKRKVSEILRQTQSLEREVMTAEHLLGFMERDIVRRLEVAGDLLEALEKKKNYTPAELEFVRKELDLLSKQLDAFSSEVKQLNDKELAFYSEIDDFRQRLRLIKASEVGRQSLFDKMFSGLQMPSLPKIKVGRAEAKPRPRRKPFWGKWFVRKRRSRK